MNNPNAMLHKNEGLVKILTTAQPSRDNDWFNACFEKEPTPEDVMIMLMKIDANCERILNKRNNEYDRVKNGGDMCCLATLSISQDSTPQQVISVIDDVVETLQTTKFKWYSDPIVRAEFYSGKADKWNPHIHFFNRRTVENGVAPSVIKQALKKKFSDFDKYRIYRFDARPKPLVAGELYVNGIKNTDKQQNIKKDEEFRKKHDISEIYYI